MGRIFFDVSDLYDHFIVADGVTGIQRFVLETCEVAVSKQARFIAQSQAFGEILEIPSAILADRPRALKAFKTGDPSYPEPLVDRRKSLKGLSGPAVVWRVILSRLGWLWKGCQKVLPAVRRAAMGQPVTFEAGDVIIILGLPNNRPSVLDHYAKLAAAGVTVYVFCHDTLPITAPEFFETIGRAQYRNYFRRAMKAASAVICNSQATRDDVAKVLKELELGDKPLRVVPLAHEFLGQPSHLDAAPAPVSTHQQVMDLLQRDYVLCVGTIEIRKNHFRIAKVWQKLMAEHPGQIPPLVIVGRLGWMKGEFLELMQETAWLEGNIISVGGVSDQDLAVLYRHCRFSVFLSMAEGWGLPIGESAWFGKPCLTSSISSMPEVLGEYGLSCDPYDEAAIADHVWRLISDKSALDIATQRVKAMPLRRWNDVALEILTLATPSTLPPNPEPSH